MKKINEYTSEELLKQIEKDLKDNENINPIKVKLDENLELIYAITVFKNEDIEHDVYTAVEYDKNKDYSIENTTKELSEKIKNKFNDFDFENYEETPIINRVAE